MADLPIDVQIATSAIAAVPTAARTLVALAGLPLAISTSSTARRDPSAPAAPPRFMDGV